MTRPRTSAAPIEMPSAPSREIFWRIHAVSDNAMTTNRIKKSAISVFLFSLYTSYISGINTIRNNESGSFWLFASRKKDLIYRHTISRKADLCFIHSFLTLKTSSNSLLNGAETALTDSLEQTNRKLSEARVTAAICFALLSIPKLLNASVLVTDMH